MDKPPLRLYMVQNDMFANNDDDMISIDGYYCKIQSFYDKLKSRNNEFQKPILGISDMFLAIIYDDKIPAHKKNDLRIIRGTIPQDSIHNWDFLSAMPQGSMSGMDFQLNGKADTLTNIIKELYKGYPVQGTDMIRDVVTFNYYFADLLEYELKKSYDLKSLKLGRI